MLLAEPADTPAGTTTAAQEETVLALITLLLGKVTRSQIVTVLILGVLAVVGGGIAFDFVEHVGLGTGLYWAVTTATTVGYGDVTPHNSAGRIVAVAVMLTAIPLFGGAFALLAAAATAARLDKYLHMQHHLPPGRFVVLLGMHPTVSLIAHQLHRAGTPVVVAADVEQGVLPSFVHHVPGSPTDEATVRATDPGRARAVLLLATDDSEMLVTAVLLRHVAPDVPAVAVAQSSMVARALSDLGIGRTISTEDLLGQTLAKSLEAPHAADVLLRMLDGDGYRMEEIPVSEDLIGSTIRDARDRISGLVLGVVHDGRVSLGIHENPVLQAGDALVRLSSD